MFNAGGIILRISLFLGILLVGEGLGGQTRFGLFESAYEKLDFVYPFDGSGFYSNRDRLEELIKSRNVKIIVEVGCWLGESTRHMASLLPSGGKVYAVDHWNGSVEHQLGQPFYSPVLHNLYERFLSNVIYAELTDKIVPIRLESLCAAKLFEDRELFEKPDLIYIDASHDFASVMADIRAWYPFVQGHGILCGDDWHYGPIVLAVAKFAREKGLDIEVDGGCWSLHEKK